MLAFALILLMLNPVGYVGGGFDDWHYLQAARCVAEQGLCLPQDHWWRRFPLVLPTGGMIALFGESRLTLALVPAAYALAAISLLTGMVERQFGRAAALLAGSSFVLTPVVSERMLHLGIDLPEFALVLGAVFCLQLSQRSGSRGWSFGCGLMLALALQCRPTMLALLPIMALAFLLLRMSPRQSLLALAGLALPLALEALAYWAATGDPMQSWKLSLAHTSIPSTELPEGVDLTKSPLFNIAYIDAWRPAAGLAIHWTVDALLNLLLHPLTGYSLLVALALIALHGRRLGRPEAGGQTLLFLILAACLFFGALVFAFAIDPKPRMFLPVTAVASTCIGVLGSLAWRDGKRLFVSLLLAPLLLKGVIAPYDAADFSGASRVAAAWIAQEPSGLAIDVTTARLAAVEPEARRLPIYAEDAADRLILIGEHDCAKAAEASGLTGWMVARGVKVPHNQPVIVRSLRAYGVMPSKPVPVVCLLVRSSAG